MTPYQVGDQLESLMERLKDMATAGVSAVAAARAAKASVKKRYGGGNGYEEDKQGDDDDDHDLANNVYDELARFQVCRSFFFKDGKQCESTVHLIFAFSLWRTTYPL